MATNSLRLAATAAFLTLVPAIAEAHPGPGGAADFAHGFAHPFLGLDHVIVMLAVGFYAAMLAGRALWIVPSAFLSMMAAGGILALNGIDLPLVEIVIALSAFTLAAMLALRLRLPAIPAVTIIGFFAIFHGNSHGSEIPADASGLVHALGFLLATALLHAAGVWLGLKLANRKLAIT